MRLDELDYDLPPERIAQQPAEPRDSARLLVDRGSAEPEHRHVHDLVSVLREGDLLVVNDTKVLPARLRLRRSSGGAAEVLLLEPLDAARRRWEALLRPARRVRPGEVLVGDDGSAVVEIGPRTAAGDTFEVTVVGAAGTAVDDAAPGERTGAPQQVVDESVAQALARHGEMPLPPYITAPLLDPGRYQTVYAVNPGSAAAPTAGLHFTPGLLADLGDAGVGLARVELVVGLDTFRPVDEPDPRRHVIHTERYRVPAETLAACREARRVVAVGTTSVRALETAVTSGELSGRTSLFIHRPYEWKVVDLMLTNFHLPRTTLLMMIDAFVGTRWRTLYATALAAGYRFLSFGDAMLLDRRAA